MKIDSLNVQIDISKIKDNSLFALNLVYRASFFNRDKPAFYDNYRLKLLFGDGNPHLFNHKALIYELYHLPTNTVLPITAWVNSKEETYPTLEIAGLHQYNQKSLNKNLILEDLKKLNCLHKITRLDIAIDTPNKPLKAIKQLKSKSKNFKVYDNGNITFNLSRNISVISYDKQLHNNLNFKCHRLEYKFKSSFFRNLTFTELPKAIKKCLKYINNSN